MGLLDGLMNRDMIFALGLLDAGSPKPVRTNIGAGLLSALGQAQQFEQGQEDRRAAAEDRKQRGLMQAMQMEQMRAAMEAQQQARLEARQAAEARNRYLGSVDPSQGPAMPVSPAAALSAGLSPQELSLIAPAAKDKKPHVLKPGEVAFDDSGRQMFSVPDKADKPPADWQLYQLSGAADRGMSFDQWDQARRRAGATNVTTKIENKTGESLASQVGPMLKDSRAQADAGLRLVDSANRVLDAAEKGNLFAGPGANLLMKGAQVADVLGLGGKTVQEKIANTRSVVRGMAEQAVSARAQLGGQAQISNAEQELLNKATSGDIAELTAGEIVQIAKLNDRLGRMMYGNHQRQLGVMQQRDDLRQLSPFYSVPDLPKPRGASTVVRTGRDAQGRRVQQMSDGTIQYVQD